MTSFKTSCLASLALAGCMASGDLEGAASEPVIDLPERMRTGAALDGDLSGDLRPEARTLIALRTFDPEAAARMIASSSIAPAAAAVTPPPTIRVWRRGLDGSTDSCAGRVDRIALERYVRGVVPHEWIPSWSDTALRAGAVAVRTYASWWVNAGGKYNCADLDDTTASQVYKDSVNARADAAVAATTGQIVVRGNSFVFAEYSAENGDPTAHGISDPPCHGKERFGHGRGLCQWGSQRWSTRDKDYKWILTHYYKDAEVVGSGGGSPGGPPEPPPPEPTDYRTITGDFDGNGMRDVLTISPNAGGGWAQWAALELSTGTRLTSVRWNAQTPTHMRNGGPDRTYYVVGGDFNGDGKTDLATLSPDAGGGWADWVYVELSTGAAFASQRWSTVITADMRNGGPDRDYRIVTGDFNGDRKTDIAVLSPDAGGGWRDWADVALSTGAGFTTARWPTVIPLDMRNGGPDRDYRVLGGDWNADGKTDIAVISPDAGGGWRDWADVALSTGTGFTTARWPTVIPLDMRNGGPDREYRIFGGDFNGDRKSDIAVISPDAGGGWSDWVDVALSTGAGFTTSRFLSTIPLDMRNGGADRTYRVVSGDINGDGKTDLAVVSPNAGGGWASWADVGLSTGSAFSTARFTTDLPVHMRNGGADREYRVLGLDATGDGKLDLVTVSPNGGGGWKDWFSVSSSTGAGFTSQVWSAATPLHMRNGQ